MSRGMLIILLMIIGGGQWASTTSKQQAGIIAEHQGKLYYEQGRLAILIDASTNNNCDTIEQIYTAYIQSINTIYKTTQSLDSKPHSHKFISDPQLERNLIHKLKSCLFRIKKLVRLTNTSCLRKITGTSKLRVWENREDNELTYLSEPKLNSRPKRGLFNLGGSLYKTLFGLATEADLRSISQIVDDSVNNLKKSNMRLTLSTMNVMTVVNASLEHIKSLTTTMNKLKETVEEFEAYSLAADHITEIQSAAEYLYSEMKYQETRITFIEHDNFLPSGFLSEGDTLSLIEEGLEKFPNLYFPFSLSEPDIEKIITYFQILPSKLSKHFVLTIPYVSKDPMELFAIYPFPVMSTNGQSVIPINLPAYAGVLNESHSDITSLKTCKHYFSSEMYICPPKATVTKKDTCASALMKGDFTKCTYRKLKLADRSLYTFKTEKSWYIFLPNKTLGAVSCPDITRNKLGNFSGIVKVTPPCSFETSTLKTPITTVIKSSFKLGSVDSYPLNAEIVKTVHIISHPNDTINDLISLQNSLNETHKKLTTLERETSVSHTFSLSLWTGLIVLLILFTFMYLIYLNRKKCRRTRNENTNERVIMYNMG